MTAITFGDRSRRAWGALGRVILRGAGNSWAAKTTTIAAALILELDGRMVPSKKHTCQGRPEHGDADNRGANRANEDGTGRYVFGGFDQRMKAGRSGVAKVLEGRVDCFCGPHRHRRAHQSNPFEARDAEGEPQPDHGDGGDGMKPSVVLRSDHR